MADIFISYAREDQEWVKVLAKALEAQGWSTWWDTRLVAGEHFDEEIEEALDNAKCVVVLWSRHSVESRWVRTEATVGMRRNILAPVFIEEVEQPLAFTLVHAVDLSRWNKKATDERFQELVHDIRQILGEDKPNPQQNPLPPKEEAKKRTLVRIGAVFSVVVAVAGLIASIRGFQPREVPARVDSVVVVPPETVPPETITQEPSTETTSSNASMETVTNAIGMEFVFIDRGRFSMGSENGKPDESPVHPVRITKGFYMGTTEVTQGQWEQVMGERPSLFQKGKDHPVEKVSWNRVQDFLQVLNRRDQRYSYRLPTEAEWEYACRAGSSTAYYYGDDATLLGRYAVYGREVQEGHNSVKSRRPNNWGLYDMMGNVAEWTADRYNRVYYNSGAVSDPAGPETGDRRVLRGGAYLNKDSVVRCALRGSSSPQYEVSFAGFRVVAEVRG